MTKKRTACLIYNPVAGQSNPEQDLELIKSILSPSIDLDIQFTTEKINADQLARQAADRGVEAVIASGGDGTLSAAASALINTDIPLGIISRGTANAFASALGIPDTIEEACTTILGDYKCRVDVAICDQKQPMVLLAGIGFEAETVKNTSRQAKNRWGIVAYVLSGIRELSRLNNNRFQATIETESKVVKVDAAAITVANAAPAFSILAQGPAGIVYNDGLLDLTIVAPEHLPGALAASYHLLQSAVNQDAADRDDIGYLRSESFTISTDPPQKIVIDGEIYGETPINIRCVPHGLNLFVPIGQDQQPTEKLEGLPKLEVKEKKVQTAEEFLEEN